VTGCATSHSVRELPHSVVVHTFRRDHANAHVVARGSNFFMVDSGYEANAAALDADMRSEGFEPAKMRAIILSHGHADHAGGSKYFHDKYGTPVVVGRGDRPLLASGKNDALCPTSDRAKGRLEEDQSATYRPSTPDAVVDAPLDLALEPLTGIAGRIVPLPGHTPGSLVVVVEDAVLVGDLFRGAILGSSAEVHFYMCDLADNRRDIQELLDVTAPDAHVYFTGHFGPVSRDAVVEQFGRRP